MTTFTSTNDRRSDLIRAAFDLIAERGFEGLRTRDVAARVGVNVATLHYYLPTKEDLIGGVAEYLAHTYATDHAAPVAPSGKPALDRLRQEFADTQRYRFERPEVMIVFRELTLRAERDPSIRAILTPLLDYWRTDLVSILSDGVRDGVFRPDVDPQVASTALMALLWGGGSLLILSESAFREVCEEVERWLQP